MITRETDYAIRTILYLADNKKDLDIVATSELAKTMNIPYRFLRSIGRKLAQAGLVNGIRGKGGGLQLKVKKEEISLLRVINAIDPKSIKLNTCLVDTNNCPVNKKCPVHHPLLKLQSLIERGLQEIMFNDLVDNIDTACKKET